MYGEKERSNEEAVVAYYNVLS